MSKIFDQRRWRSLLIHILLLGTVYASIHWWQTRHLVTSGEAPIFEAFDLQGNKHAPVPYGLSSQNKARKTLLYFFAPWCSVCKLSAANLNTLQSRSSSQELAVYAVALSYDNQADVFAFAQEQNLKVPVLLGDDRILAAYRVTAFPTYYVLGSEAEVLFTSVGYSTSLGLILRTF